MVSIPSDGTFNIPGYVCLSAVFKEFSQVAQLYFQMILVAYGAGSVDQGVEEALLLNRMVI